MTQIKVALDFVLGHQLFEFRSNYCLPWLQIFSGFLQYRGSEVA